MIPDYRDHAANERTFLAWVRTGIAVIALGVVIEKFNLFLLTFVAYAGDAAHRLPAAKTSAGLGHYEGLALIFGGVALLVLSTIRFARTTWRLDDAQTHSASNIRTELILSAVLVLLIGSYSIYLALS